MIISLILVIWFVFYLQRGEKCDLRHLFTLVSSLSHTTFSVVPFPCEQTGERRSRDLWPLISNLGSSAGLVWVAKWVDLTSTLTVTPGQCQLLLYCHTTQRAREQEKRAKQACTPRELKKCAKCLLYISNCMFSPHIPVITLCLPPSLSLWGNTRPNHNEPWL